MRRLGGRLTLALASKLLGVGPRQLQRVALRQAGASLQTTLRLWRGQRSFLLAQRAYFAGRKVDMADHALANDYADQSHMVRDCKAQTGRTPMQLARDVALEEADWIYRLELPLMKTHLTTRLTTPPTTRPPARVTTPSACAACAAWAATSSASGAMSMRAMATPCT
ncbi:AraC family transcriptional regulator [Massilia sp. Dwa41.01b]|uniref:helix-turn-helix domain-containing protein n=1 Tax=Massilia sp. Dwa41.01b TaxID=2709302 RepID=UPI0016024A5B|nr:helix-turn-helix domain-containing protein [Massilia sp. Dwa41.01b]QNA89721.1 AraC family transcriptional regulator [Massilia sp. Dwa41.01b]